MQADDLYLLVEHKTIVQCQDCQHNGGVGNNGSQREYIDHQQRHGKRRQSNKLALPEMP